MAIIDLENFCVSGKFWSRITPASLVESQAGGLVMAGISERAGTNLVQGTPNFLRGSHFAVIFVLSDQNLVEIEPEK